MTTKTMLTATAAALALSIGAAAPALADAAMCKDGMMVKSDTMGGDMKQDPMMKDNAMAKGGEMAMKDDGMKKDDMMKDNTMAKGGEMAMKDDGMKKGDTTMDDKSMGAGMMTADYTVKTGDSLWSIAAMTLCDGKKYPTIVAANADMLKGGMTIQPGQVLHIPGD